MDQRPLPCRICECPVADTGVPLSGLDLEKFRRWWKHELERGGLGRPLDDDDEALCSSWICQFCLWHSGRWAEDTKTEAFSGLNWWVDVQDENDLFQQCQFTEEEIKPGEVRITKVNPVRRDSSAIVTVTVETEDIDNDVRTKVEMIPCVYCKQFFPSLDAFSAHVSLYHGDVQTIKCHLCGVYCYSEEEKKIHDEKFHFSRLIECHCCSKLVLGKLGMTAHIVSSHNDLFSSAGLIKCCGFVFNSREAVLGHMTFKPRDRGEAWAKAIVPVQAGEILGPSKPRPVGAEHNYFKVQSTTKKEDLRMFEIVQCSHGDCAQYFQTQEKLDMHYLQKHNGVDKLKLMTCDKCGYNTYHLEYLKRHEEMNHNPEGYPCSRCWVVFNTDHYRNLHSCGTIFKRCTFCQTYVKNLSNHLRAPPCHFCRWPMQCRKLLATHLQNCSMKPRILK